MLTRMCVCVCGPFETRTDTTPTGKQRKETAALNGQNVCAIGGHIPLYA